MTEPHQDIWWNRQQGFRQPQVNSTTLRNRLQRNTTKTKINTTFSFSWYFWGHNLEAYLQLTANHFFVFPLVMFQREKHHTTSEQGGIRTVSELCRLSGLQSYRSRRHTSLFFQLQSMAIFQTNQQRKKSPLPLSMPKHTQTALTRYTGIKTNSYFWFISLLMWRLF